MYYLCIKLKVFLSVDIEGISGITHGSQISAGQPDYDKGRALMVGDVNAAIEGALTLTEVEIVVSDGHGSMCNIKPEELHEAAMLIRGSPKPLTMMEGIDQSYDAALFIGYHAKKGTKLGLFDHTISGGIIDSITINGLEVGETGINAAIAGYYGVPLIFLSGDLAVANEVKALVPNIITVVVKEAVSRTAAKCLNPKQARKLIKEGVIEALKKRKSIEPFRFKPPIEMRIKYGNTLMADAVEFMPSTERVDGRTIKSVFNDYIKAFRAARASIYIASAVSR